MSILACRGSARCGSTTPADKGQRIGQKIERHGQTPRAPPSSFRVFSERAMLVEDGHSCSSLVTVDSQEFSNCLSDCELSTVYRD